MLSMAKQISLSFKENEMDMYAYLKSKSSPSIYIKELVERDMGKVVRVKEEVVEIKEEVKEKQEQNNISLSALRGVGK